MSPVSLRSTEQCFHSFFTVKRITAGIWRRRNDLITSNQISKSIFTPIPQLQQAVLCGTCTAGREVSANRTHCAMLSSLCCVGVRWQRHVIGSCSVMWVAATKTACRAQPEVLQVPDKFAAKVVTRYVNDCRNRTIGGNESDFFCCRVGCERSLNARLFFISSKKSHILAQIQSKLLFVY